MKEKLEMLRKSASDRAKDASLLMQQYSGGKGGNIKKWNFYYGQFMAFNEICSMCTNELSLL